jgi:hypothetical protein
MDLAAEVDVITIMPEYLGLPFDQFYASVEPNPGHPWTIAMRDLAARSTAAGKPIMLELVLTRDAVVGAAFNHEGSLIVVKNWAPRCMPFDNSLGELISTAYKNYAVWMTNLFRPTHLVVFVEMNLYYVHCGGAAPSCTVLIPTERDAYDRVKSVRPETAVFPSFKLEDLYGQTVDGFDELQYAAMAGTKRDRFGIAAYPYGMRKQDGTFVNPFDLPLDYLQRVHQRHPNERRIVVTETGWISNGPSFGTTSGCYGPFPFSALPFAQIYLEILLYNAYAGNFDLISWWSNRDLLPTDVMTSCYPATAAPTFPACGDDPWCRAVLSVRTAGLSGDSNFDELAFKAFGSMGLRSYDGTAKGPLKDRWTHFFSLPVIRP